MTRSRLRHQGGATLVEAAIVIVFLLGSLLLLTSMLGKMMDARLDYEQGLRYAAWERTVWFEARPANAQTAAVKSSAQIATEVQNRIFAERNAAIRSDQGNANRRETMDNMLMRPVAIRLNSNTSAYQPWLVDANNGRGNPVYTRSNVSNNGVPGPAAQGVNAMIDGISALTSFSVQKNGLYGTQLTADLDDTGYWKEFRENARDNGRMLDLRLDRNGNGGQRELLLLSDGWNLGGPGHVTRQVQSLVATELLDNPFVDTLFDIVSWFPMARELGWLEFGKVDPEQVPPQRLGRQ